MLVQVCLDTTDDATWEREVLALELAAGKHPDAVAILITADQTPPLRSLPGRMRWYSATEWLLSPDPV